MPGTVAEAVESSDELVKQSGKQGSQVAKSAAIAVLSSEESKVASLSVSLKKACE